MCIGSIVIQIENRQEQVIFRTLEVDYTNRNLAYQVFDALDSKKRLDLWNTAKSLGQVLATRRSQNPFRHRFVDAFGIFARGGNDSRAAIANTRSELDID